MSCLAPVSSAVRSSALSDPNGTRTFIGTSADSESLAELHEVEAQGIYSVRATTGAVLKPLLLPRPVGGVDRTTQRSVVDPGPEQKRHDRDVTMSEAPMESEGAPEIERGTFVPRSSLPDAFGPRTILVAGVDPDVVAESLSQTSLGTVPVAAAPIGPQTGIRVWDALEAAARGDGSKDGWQSQDPRDFPFILISGVQRGEVDEIMQACSRIDWQRPPAFAIAVPNAMDKPLFALYDEVEADHEERLNKDSAGVPALKKLIGNIGKAFWG